MRHVSDNTIEFFYDIFLRSFPEHHSRRVHIQYRFERAAKIFELAAESCKRRLEEGSRGVGKKKRN